MPTYVIVNRAPKGYRPSPEAQQAWTAWFQRLDAALVDRGNPVFSSTTLGATGVETALGGYTLVSADDLEAAVALATSCPALSHGGGVEVGELTLLNQRTQRIGE
jgi:hypothetical protein